MMKISNKQVGTNLPNAGLTLPIALVTFCHFSEINVTVFCKNATPRLY